MDNHGPFSVPIWLKGQRVAVTGASGILGSRLVRCLLSHGVETIHALSRTNKIKTNDDRLKNFVGDICQLDFLEEALAKCNVVFHLAAEADVERARCSPLESFRVNSQGTAYVLEACCRQEVESVIYCSTCHVYGPFCRDKIDETHPTRPASVYASSKLAGENILQGYLSNSEKLTGCAVRFTNLYGFYDNDRTVVSKAIRQVASGGHIALDNLWSKRDFVHINDAVQALLRLAMISNKNVDFKPILNVSYGRCFTIKDMVHLLSNAAVDLGLRRPLIKGDESECLQKSENVKIDNSRLFECTGWLPSIDLEQGLYYSLREAVDTIEGRSF